MGVGGWNEHPADFEGHLYVHELTFLFLKVTNPLSLQSSPGKYAHISDGRNAWPQWFSEAGPGSAESVSPGKLEKQNLRNAIAGAQASVCKSATQDSDSCSVGEPWLEALFSTVQALDLE
jgi:hypothetical protein